VQGTSIDQKTTSELARKAASFVAKQPMEWPEMGIHCGQICHFPAKRQSG